MMPSRASDMHSILFQAIAEGACIPPYSIKIFRQISFGRCFPQIRRSPLAAP
jgi:hypothetical protein